MARNFGHLSPHGITSFPQSFSKMACEIIKPCTRSTSTSTSKSSSTRQGSFLTCGFPPFLETLRQAGHILLERGTPTTPGTSRPKRGNYRKYKNNYCLFSVCQIGHYSTTFQCHISLKMCAKINSIPFPWKNINFQLQIQSRPYKSLKKEWKMTYLIENSKKSKAVTWFAKMEL